jgi:hypothetical protein
MKCVVRLLERDLMKASETAIVFIEFQNDFCNEEGALYGAVKNQIAAQGTIKNAADCINKARGKCLTFVAPILFEQNYRDAGCQGVLGSIHTNVMKGNAFKRRLGEALLLMNSSQPTRIS